MQRIQRIDSRQIELFDPKEVIPIQDGWFYAFSAGIKHGIIREGEKDIAFVVLNGNADDFPHAVSSQVQVYQRFGHNLHYHCEDALFKVVEVGGKKFIEKKTEADKVRYIA